MHKMMSKSWMTWQTQGSRPGNVCIRRHHHARDGRTLTERQAQACHIYLLVHRDEPRFKIGISQRPLDRVKTLPDGAEINRANSFQVLFPSRDRANEVEKGLHRLLSGLRLHVTEEGGQRWDGGTEWFSIQGLSVAINILQNIPLDENGEGSVVLQRLDAQAVSTAGGKRCPYEARMRRQFDAAQINIGRMNEVARTLRRLNDELTVTWRPAEQRVLADKATASEKTKTLCTLAHGEMVCLHELGDLWESETLALRYRLTDSQFWMFETGKVGEGVGQQSWLRRIQFDWKNKTSLLLFVEDRAVLEKLPGGRAALRLWDALWD